MLRKFAVVTMLALSVVACDSNDDDGTGPGTQHELVGTWVSTGTNIAPGLRAAPFRTKNLTATFNSNNTYTVVSTDSANVNTTFTGTWSAPAGTNGTVRAITLNQSTPTQLTSTGIFQVNGSNLTYEVIQTTPAIQGFLAPTVAGGFGSTSYNGVALGALWTQRFVKQ